MAFKKFISSVVILSPEVDGISLMFFAIVEKVSDSLVSTPLPVIACAINFFPLLALVKTSFIAPIIVLLFVSKLEKEVLGLKVPSFPCIPCSPRSPLSPFTPFSPCIPCSPRSPFSPFKLNNCSGVKSS